VSLLQRIRQWLSDRLGTSHNYRIEECEDGIERHHDPYWFHTPEVDPSDKPQWYVEAKEGRQPKRNTDYELPEAWGRMSPEEKSQWYLSQRVWRQINRQYDAGMWDQWDVETLQAGLTPREGAGEVNKDEYSYSDD